MAGEPPIDVHLDLLFQNSADPIFLVNAARRVVFFNQACESLFGVPREQVLGLECRYQEAKEAGSPSSVAASLVPPPEALTGQAATCQVLIHAADGARAWRAIDFIPLNYPDHTVSAVLGRIRQVDQDSSPPPETEPLRQAYARLRQRLFERFQLDQVPAVGPAMRRVLAQARLASQNLAPVLLFGERGTGKEHLARMVHYQGRQSERAFVALDCERLPLQIVIKHLSEAGFGSPLPGRMGAAVGTLYLREPAWLPRDFQKQLSEWLEKKPLEPAPRLMAGSRINLQEACGQGGFLESLYGSLSIQTLELPPLRVRKAELPFLVQQALEALNANSEHQVTELRPDAWELVRRYHWPGNLRELNEVLAQAHSRGRAGVLLVQDFPMPLRSAVELADLPGVETPRPLPLEKLLLEAERRLISLALRDAKGNKSRAAARLEIPRARLYRRMQVLGIEDPEKAAPEGLLEIAPEGPEDKREDDAV